MAKRKRGFNQDLSSFMCVILMLIGAMVIILISNVVIIISNPENIRITSIIRTVGVYTGMDADEMGGPAPFPYGNRIKEPLYVDVNRNHLIIYPGGEIVSMRDLEKEGNAFERLLDQVESNREEQYIILLARPGTANIIHRLKVVVRDRDIDLGCELYEAERPVDYDSAARASGVLKKK